MNAPVVPAAAPKRESPLAAEPALELYGWFARRIATDITNNADQSLELWLARHRHWESIRLILR
jgi:hypothetical protein